MKVLRLLLASAILLFFVGVNNTAIAQCTGISAPFMENFDGLALTSPYTAMPTCWSQTGPDNWDVTNGSTNSPAYLAGFNDHTTGSGNFMWIDASGDITVNAMETPDIDLSSLTTPYAGFWFGSNNTTNATLHTINLDVWDGTAWVNIATESGNFPSWVEVTGVVPASIPAITKFRIYATAASGTNSGNYYQNDLGVDDFFVVEAPTCLKPTLLTVTNVTSSGADFGWTDANGATSWEIESGAPGFTQGTGTTAMVSSNPTTITSFAPATAYDLYVRAVCAAGDSSEWEGPISVTTACLSTLSGTYTIGGAGADYADFAAAAVTLNTCGISGPVTFNVSAGTYTGSMMLGQINGTSMMNTISFVGAGAATTTLTHDATSQNATVLLDGADYITFQDLTIQNTSTANDSWGIRLTNRADNITVSNCNIDMPANLTSFVDIVGIVGSASATASSTGGDNAHNLTVTNTDFVGGWYGLRLEGGGTSNVDSTVVITNCHFDGNTGYGIYFDDVDDITISNTTIDGHSTSSKDGIYHTDVSNYHYDALNIDVPDYGMYFSDGNDAAISTPNGQSTITNCIIYSTTDEPLYGFDMNNTDIYHNTFVTIGGTSAYGMYQSSDDGNVIKNNIFYSDAGYAIYIASAASDAVVDYNIYYNTGANLAYYGGAKADLTIWQTDAPTLNINSLSGDPSFTGPTDFHLVGTLANDAGEPLGVMMDIDGDTRSATTPDIGADEYTPPSCSPPTALTAAALATTADLGWTAGGTETMWDVEFGTSGFTQGMGTMVTATMSNPYSATMLTPNSAYEFYVRANCGGATSPWVGPFSFTTACVAATAPFMENFDGLALTSPYTALPSCWDAQVGPDYWDVTNDVTNNSHTYLPNIGDHTTGTGNYMWIDASSDITGNAMVTPLIDMTALTAPYAGFWFASDNTNNAVNHTINLDAWDGTAWVNIASQSGNFTGWVEVAGAVPASIPTITKFRIQAVAATGTTSSTYYFNDLGVDDFFVMEMPSCDAPTALLANNITTTTADLAWTAGGSETSWEVEYGVTGFTQGTGTAAVVSTNPYSVSGLTFETDYQFYVRAICGPGDTSAWVGPISFFTGYCTASPSSVDGTGITNVTMGGVNNTTGAEPGNYGNYSAMVANGQQGVALPIDITLATGYTYDMWAWVDWNNDLDFTDPGEEFFLGTSISTNPTTFSSSIAIPVTATIGNYRIRIGGADSGLGTTSPSNPCYTGSYGSFEDYTLSVAAAPSCVPVSALTVTNVMATGATLGWTENGSATTWEVEYGVTGFTPGTGMSAIVTTNPHMISGLTFETNYQFYVRAICGVGDTSIWSSAGAFFTGYCNPSPANVDGNGITNVTMGGVNNTTGTEPGNYGNYSAMIANAPQGGTLPIDITLETGYTYDMWAWVDWNNDLDFTDPGEEFFLGTSTSMNPTVFSSSIAIPATATGNYRIRIGGADTGLGTTSPSDPCYTGFYASFEDYTLNVALPLSPFANLTPADGTLLSVAGPAQNTVDITWESAQVPGATYEWLADLPGGDFSSALAVIPSNNMGMDTMLTLNIQQIDDLLASLGVAIGDTAMIQWTAAAYAGMDTLLATTPFTLSLVRYGISTPLFVNAPTTNGATSTLRAPNGTTAHSFIRTSTMVFPTDFSNSGIPANTTIRNFGFNINGTVPDGPVVGVLNLYLQNTTDVAYSKGNVWAGITPGMTNVYSDTVTIDSGVVQWNVVLDSLFNYGGDAVYVAYDWELISGIGTAISYMSNSTVSGALVTATSTTAPPATLTGSSSFRPEFAWGIDRDADDLEVVTLYALGKNPLGYSQPEQVQAIVRNNGYLPADKMVSLTITGANPFTASENVVLAPGQETTVTFAAFTPTMAGFNDMLVDVPADDNTANSSQSWVQETTTNTFAYADSVLTGLGGVGYNTGSGLLLTRYFVDGPASVNSVNIHIADGAAIVGNTIYAVLVDTSGAIVGQSANYTVAAGDLNAWKTFTLNTPVNFDTEDIWVGLAQTANAATGYFPVSFQSESPTRAAAYYTGDLAGGNYGTVNGFRLLIEAVVAPACVATSTSVVTNANCFGDASGSIAVTVTGGTAPYTYAWNDGQTTATATGLTANVYDVTITDANGCILNATETVGQPSAIVLTTATVSDTMNLPNIGQASVTATGGTAPYTYAWSDGQTTATATGLDSGTYGVTVTDGNGCTDTSSVFVDIHVSTNNIEYLTELSIAPNPTRGNTVINLELSRNADVAVSIYTVTGVLVEDFGKENTSSQTHQVDLSAYADGMYFVRIVIDNQVITKKLMINK